MLIGMNYAFIDANNLNLGIQRLGWSIDHQKLSVYLKEKYKIEKIFMFLGYIPKYEKLYKRLKDWGYIIIFKPVLYTREGNVKGNCDAELVLHAMIEFQNYDKALIITGDGDFSCLVSYLYNLNKLLIILSPSSESCSVLIKKTSKGKLVYMDNLENKLRYK